jgi:hypothetical protein
MNVRSVALSLTVALGLTLPAYAQQTAVCKDDTNWSGPSRSGACARHGGVKEWTTNTSAPASAAVPPSTVAPSASAPASAAVPPSTVAPSATPKMQAGRFSTESDAKAHCAGQNVVWMNNPSKIYHWAGSRDYGHTKNGAYMCQADADKIGRAAKNEKAPSR